MKTSEAQPEYLNKIFAFDNVKVYVYGKKNSNIHETL